MTKYLLIALVMAVFGTACTPGGGSKMMSTDDGVQYQFIKDVSGDSPVDGEFVYFHAEAASLEGDVVSSTATEGKPGIMQIATPPPTGRKNPFLSIMKTASVGDSVHIHLNKEMSSGSGFDSLIYKIGILEIVDEATYNARADEEASKAAAETSRIESKVQGIYQDIKSGKLNDQTVTTASGLQYIIHEKGDGPIAKNGDAVPVDYYGILSTTGEEFDNSWKRGSPYAVNVGAGSVIKGWDEALITIPRGSKATVIIPADLAYGGRAKGKIGANAELIFYLEINK